MKYTIDSSIWVNSFDTIEIGSGASRQFILEVEKRGITVVLPSLALVEIAGSISRTRNNSLFGERYARAVGNRSNITLINLSQRLTQQAILLAARQRLRGADAVYAVVALRENSTLVSRDREHITRLVGIVHVQTPEEALRELGEG